MTQSDKTETFQSFRRRIQHGKKVEFSIFFPVPQSSPFYYLCSLIKGVIL